MSIRINRGHLIIIPLSILLSIILWTAGALQVKGQGSGSSDQCFAQVESNLPIYSSIDAHAVQEAVDAASSGETVKVAGDCAGVELQGGSEQTVYINKALTMQGGYTTDFVTLDPVANPTTLDALNHGRVIVIDGSINVVIENLQVTGGQSTGDGGGIYAVDATMTLSNTQVSRNTSANQGGGLWTDGDVTIIDTTFANNWAISTTAGSNSGGGAYVEGNATITDSRFEHNISQKDSGGGLYVDGTLDMTGSTFERNLATTGDGGGIYVSGAATIDTSDIEGNYAVAGSGGGLYAKNSLDLTRTAFVDNSAIDGGGVYFDSNGNADIVNGVFARNAATDDGVALYLDSVGTVNIRHATIANPSVANGTAIYVHQGTVDVANSIISSHATGIEQNNGTVSEDYNLFFANTNDTQGSVTSGGNSLTGDPAFSNAVNDDYRLTSASAALDAATDLGITTDFDGVSRPQGVGHDMGAFETEEINNSLAQQGTNTSYNPTPVQPHAPAGVLTIAAQFGNIGSRDFQEVFFKVTDLSNNNVLLNADGGPAGVGAVITVPSGALGGSGAPLEPGESFNIDFEIGLNTAQPFNFTVDAYGLPVERLRGLNSQPVRLSNQSFHFEIKEGELVITKKPPADLGKAGK